MAIISSYSGQANHSLVPTRLPPQGDHALASDPAFNTMEAVPVTPGGPPGLPVQGRQFEAVRPPSPLPAAHMSQPPPSSPDKISSAIDKAWSELQGFLS